MRIAVIKAMAKLLFSWVLLVVLIIWNYYNWRLGDGSASFFSFMIFWFYYEINNKDIQLQEIHGNKNLSFSRNGILKKLKSLRKSE